MCCRLFSTLFFLLSFLSPLHSQNYQVLGIGAPYIDVLIPAEEEFVASLPGEKGGASRVDWATFTFIMEYAKTRDYKIATGGSCANTIKGLACLGETCALCGKMGTDENGIFFLNNIIPLGIIPRVSISETPTSQVACLVTSDQQRTMRCFPGAGVELTPDDLTDDLFVTPKIVHIEGYAIYNKGLIQRVIAYAKEHDCLVSFDMGCFEIARTFKEEILSFLPDVDIVFANQDEVKELLGVCPSDGCLQLKDICDVAVILVGKEGCLVGNSEKLFKARGLPAKVVDTTGAGDLFASGFLYGFLRGKSLEECAHYGNVLGSAVVEYWGAEIPPDRWDIIKEQLSIAQ